jgi:peptide/nickel transport system ATP-binding protein
MSLLEFRDFRLVFDGFEGTSQVLDGITLDMEAGETVGLVGETGCGKSVLAKSILRLNDMPPARVTSGSVSFAGQDVMKLPAAELQRLRGARAAMIFQDPVTFLNPLFDVGNQLADVLHARDKSEEKPARSSSDVKEAATQLLASVGLPDPAGCLERFPHELSGGMRQRVLIAMALAGAPELLIADEPTTALDVTVQAQILRLIADLVETRGLTLLLVSHDLGVIGALCRRIMVMYAGTIVEDGAATDVFGQPRHPYTQGLLAATPDLARSAAGSGIAGSIPSLIDPPLGCRFHPRCSLAIARCRTEKPHLRATAAHHLVACHLAEAAS